MTQLFFLHLDDIFTDFPNNAITKMTADNRHVSQHLPTSSSDSMRWTSSSGMMAILGVDCAQQSPDSGKMLRPTTWESGTSTHYHCISRRPHQQYRVLRSHTTCTLIQEWYFKSVDTLRRNVTRRWLSCFDTCSALSYRARQWQHISETWSASYMPHKRETLTVVIWHVLCVVLQGKTMTAYIWNMVNKLHASQTGNADCRDLTRALRCLTGQDNDSIYLKHGLQVTRRTNGHFKLVLQVLRQCCQSHSFNPHIEGEEDITLRDTAYYRAEEKMCSFPCCECDITQRQNVWSPQSEITMFYWSFLFFYEMMQLYTKQCSLYPTRVLAWHFMPMNKTVFRYKKYPQVISYLLTNFIWSMIMQ